MMATALWTSDELASATGGTATGAFDATGVTFDSREVGPGDLFIALKGEATDGHLFVGAAQQAGAAGALVSQPVGLPHVLVGDTMAALKALARVARARTEAQIIGVTGSVGKTTTKEMLFTALDRCAPGQAHRSVKSYNNHTGVPLSLARMPADTRYGVFEMGMSGAGEIAALTRLVRPHVAVVTAIASAHVEQLGSLEAIADAKSEIFAGLESGGTAILPFGTPYRERLLAAAQAHAARIVTFGFEEGADARPLYAVNGPDGTMVTARIGEAQISFTLPLPGQHMVANALAVLAAVDAVGGDLALAALALSEMQGLRGRGERHRIAVGGGEALLIDESYNANPASMEATLAVLGAEPVRGRRIAVLGTMRELGGASAAAHAGLAGPVRAAGVSRLILVGEEMAALAKALGAEIDLSHVADAAAARDVLKSDIAPGDAILVKGSNAVGLSALVAALAKGSA
jgi:UDP-N-acetylmuramoyl-tripeptide--D-alanyl-D-alanine ligase